MLTRVLGRAAAVLVLAAAGVAVVSAPAQADYVYCPPLGGVCYVVVTSPGGPGGGGGGGGGGGSVRTCTWAGFEVPCSIETYDGVGWFHGGDGCYYFLMSPPPPAGSPLWQGHQPGDGAVYALLCYPPDRIDPLGIGGVGFAWLQNPPPGFGGGLTPAQLAARAINQLPIRGPDIGIAPQENGAGLVGLPVWLWTAVSPQTWGPISATASVPGLSVTATAWATRIVWQMGDGHSVTCTNPGTPYRREYGRTPSPTCGYPAGYADPSNPRYTVVATTTWHVTWAGGGESGALDVTRASTASIDIDQSWVVTS